MLEKKICEQSSTSYGFVFSMLLVVQPLLETVVPSHKQLKRNCNQQRKVFAKKATGEFCLWLSLPLAAEE